MVLTSTLGFACSVVGIRTTKEPSYRVVRADGDVEVREYASYLVARTEATGDYDASGSAAFRRLFGYISGKNTATREISMTAPVIQERTGEKIAMTAPVLQERAGKTWRTAFVMPAAYTLDNAPAPLDPSIIIEEVPGRFVAVLRYRGFVSEETIAERSRELGTWLAAASYRVVSEPRSARYDPPFALPFLRRNEVHVTVEPTAAN